MAKRNYPEHILQCAIVQYCDVRHWPIFAIPNGGFRFLSTARMLKAEGVRPGVPDLFLPVAAYRFNGFFIECKSVSGQWSDNQQEWTRILNDNGYLVQVHSDLGRAIDALNWYMGDE
jgi:hypothetical protein